MFSRMQWTLQIKFFSLDPQIQTSHPVEYYSFDWLTCRWRVIMLTVDSGGGVEEQKQQSVSKNGNFIVEKATCSF